MKRTILQLLLFLFWLPDICSAQIRDGSGNSEDTVILNEAVIKDSYRSMVPLAKTLDLQYIKRENLLLSQGNTFMNTLEKMPGISAIHTGVGISKPVIRGMSLNRVIVNEYGIRQEGQQWGVDHGLEIDQYNVDRVEVIKGPVSVMYGSDGIGGVINILPPLIPDNDTVSAEVISAYKSNNDLWGWSGKLLYNRKGNFTLARVTYQDYASYKVPAKEFMYNGYVLPIHNNRLKNTGGRELNFSLLKGIRRKWGNSSIYVSSYRQKAGFFVGAFGVPRAYQLNDDGHYRNIGLPYQRISHTKIVSNTSVFLRRGSIEADFGFQKNTRAEMSPPHAHGYGPAPQGNEALMLELYTFSGNARYVHYGSGKWSNTTGLSFQYQENVRGGYEFLIPSYTSWQKGAYHFAEYRPGRNLLLNAGVRADFGAQKADASFVSQFDSTGAETGKVQRSPNVDRRYFNVSGSLGASWERNKALKTKFNIGSAYRIPVMAELTANGVHHGTFRHEMGDSSLQAEKGYMADMGIEFTADMVNVRFTPFVNYFTNYLYLSPSARFSPLPDAGQIYRYVGGEALFTGVELNADWKVLPGLNNNFSVEYVWNKNLSSGLGLPFTPPLSILEEISWKPKLAGPHFLKQAVFTLTGQYFAAQNRVERNEPATEGYFLLGFSASETFKAAGQQFTLFLQFRNVTNTVYVNNMSRYRILNLPEQGFNTQLMLRWELL